MSIAAAGTAAWSSRMPPLSKAGPTLRANSAANAAKYAAAARASARARSAMDSAPSPRLSPRGAGALWPRTLS